MKLLEAYSLAAGQKIDKIDIIDTFYPLPFNKYIVLQPYSKPSKTYDMMQEVIDLIFPTLNKLGIAIVQTGANGETPLRGCYHTQGKTTINDLAYIVRNSIAVLSVDSAVCHLAGFYNRPLVMLVSNNFKEVVAPYFGDKNRQIILEPDKTKFPKPSFSLEESPKSINSIKPEDVVASFLSLLGFNIEKRIDSLHIGNQYYAKTVEVVPDQYVDIRSLGIDTSIIRADYHFNLENIIKILQTVPGHLVLDREVDINVLLQYKPQIYSLNFHLKQNPISSEYLETLKDNGFKYYLVSDETNPEQIKALKFKYFSHGLIQFRDSSIPSELAGKNDLFYKSSKFVLYNGKIYDCYAAILENKPLNGFQHENKPIIDRPEFWIEKNNFYFIQRN